MSSSRSQRLPWWKWAGGAGLVSAALVSTRNQEMIPGSFLTRRGRNLESGTLFVPPLRRGGLGAWRSF